MFRVTCRCQRHFRCSSCMERDGLVTSRTRWRGWWVLTCVVSAVVLWALIGLLVWWLA